jgi:hypothetical protein
LPKNLRIVFAFVGDSTITNFLPDVFRGAFAKAAGFTDFVTDDVTLALVGLGFVTVGFTTFLATAGDFDFTGIFFAINILALWF